MGGRREERGGRGGGRRERESLSLLGSLLSLSLEREREREVAKERHGGGEEGERGGERGSERERPPAFAPCPQLLSENAVADFFWLQTSFCRGPLNKSKDMTCMYPPPHMTSFCRLPLSKFALRMSLSLFFCLLRVQNEEVALLKDRNAERLSKDLEG